MPHHRFLKTGSFKALVAPKEMFAKALNRNLNMQLYIVLYIYGNTPASIARSIRRFEAL